MTITKESLIKQIVSNRMLTVEDGDNYQQILDELYTDLRDKDIDYIVTAYNTIATIPVTVSEVSTLLWQETDLVYNTFSSQRFNDYRVRIVRS